MQGKSAESLEAWLLLLEFSFTQLNLKEVIAYVFPDNARAIRFYEFFGGVVCESSATKNYSCKEVHFDAEKLSASKPAIMKKFSS